MHRCGARATDALPYPTGTPDANAPIQITLPRDMALALLAHLKAALGVD